MTLKRLLADALSDERTPLMIVLAGSNGAGKTTFFDAFLRSSGLPFVNADEVARAVTPAAGTDAYAAARMAELLRRDLLRRRVTFCMETVLSDPRGDKLRFLRLAQRLGYRVLFLWIRIESAELSVARVMQRVATGGHDVPDEKLSARFPRTLENARTALRFVDLGLVVDNSSVDAPFRHLETWVRGERRPISDSDI